MPQRPDNAAFAAKQESEEYQRLINTIQRQAEQIGSLITTVNSQVRSVEIEFDFKNCFITFRRNKSNNC